MLAKRGQLARAADPERPCREAVPKDQIREQQAWICRKTANGFEFNGARRITHRPGIALKSVGGQHQRAHVFAAWADLHVPNVAAMLIDDMKAGLVEGRIRLCVD